MENINAFQSTWIVIPAFNESTILPSIIGKLLDDFQNIVVIDDGSQDDTAKHLSSLPVHILRHAMNLGQGAALQTGFDYVLKQDPKWIATFDADGQMNQNDLKKMILEAESNQCDVVLGTRFSNGNEKLIPPARRTILKLAILLTRLTTGLNVTDTHNGMRVFSKSALEKIHIRYNRMAHASDILFQIKENQLRYQESPTQTQYTAYSKAKGQRTSNLFNILWDLIFQ